MLSLKQRVSFLVMGIAVFLAVSFMLVFYFRVETAAWKAEEVKAITDLEVTQAILDLRYPGHWNVKDGELYKGQTQISNNHSVVDDIKGLTGDACVIFLRNICVATTVPEGECSRAIGVYAPYEVISKSLEFGGYHTGRAELAGTVYRTAYKPIKSEYGEIIGVLYVGVPTLVYDTVFYDSFKTLGWSGLGLIMLAGLITRVFVARSVGGPRRETPAALTSDPDRAPEVRQQAPDPVGEPLQPAEREQAGRSKPEENQDCPKEDENGWPDASIDLLQDLPKGLNRGTLNQIVSFLKRQAGNEITIQEVSMALSFSKVTVRNYFDYLHESGLVDMEQKYGSVGRPLKIYRLKK
ncbi:MAG: cache domain-containing protein [Negativicutes bacterium]|nr:cache domain-containing protein [Negativicutes bacterium]